MAWLLHGASLHDGGYAVQSVSDSSVMPPIIFPVPSSSAHELPTNPLAIGDAQEPSAAGYLPSDVEMITKSQQPAPPNAPLLPTVFRWNNGGHEIYISGTFNNWQARIPMARRWVSFCFTFIFFCQNCSQFIVPSRCRQQALHTHCSYWNSKSVK